MSAAALALAVGGAFFLAACGVGGESAPSKVPDSVPSIPSKKPVVVFIGDSITKGWPAALFPEVDVINRGVPGENSKQIEARFVRDALDAMPAAVVLMAGTNDVSQSDAPEFRWVEAMAMQARTAGVPLVVATIPPIANDDAAGGADAVRARGRCWNDRVRQLQFTHGVTVAGVWGSLVSVGDESPYPGVQQPDRVHLTAQGYSRAAVPVRVALGLAAVPS